MFERECGHVKDGYTRMIPKLREAHIIRDSWIKLNVAHAKIMQVSMLFVYSTSLHTSYNYSKSKYWENYLIM